MIGLRFIEWVNVRQLQFAALSGILAAAVAMPFGWAAAVLSGWLAASAVMIAIIDAKMYIVPDALSLPMIPIGLLSSGSMFRPDVVEIAALDHFLAAIWIPALVWLAAHFYEKVRGRVGLGMGDVKLMAAAAAWIGPQAFPYYLLFCCLSALLAQAVMHRAMKLETRVAFAVHLAPWIWIYWFASLVLDMQAWPAP